MSIVPLITSLKQYEINNPTTRDAIERFFHLLEAYSQSAFANNNWEGHITGSMLITNTERTRVLLMFHKKLQFWVQFGGHCDSETDVLAVAIRELHEESGIEIEPVIHDGIFDVHVHDISLDKKGTPPHKHYDILYLATIPDDTLFTRQESEVDDIRWFDIDSIGEYVGEKRMLYMMEKIKKLRNV